MLESIRALIESGTYPPVLLLFGEEDFLIEEACEQLVQAVAGENPNPFNFDVLDGSECKAERLIETASAFPMMSDYRVIVVKHFDKMLGGKINKKAQEKHPFNSYFGRPNHSTFMILQADAPTLNGLSAALKNPRQKDKARKKIDGARFPYNLIMKNGNWMEFRSLYEREVPSWVDKRFKSLKREITPDACELLLSQVGFSLRELHNEIGKILTFVGNKKRIDKDDITNVTGASKNYNIFELQKAVGRRKIAATMEILNRMLAVSKQELMIITMLARYFGILWKMHEAGAKSANDFALGKTLGVSPYFVPEYRAAAERYPVRQVEHALVALCNADLRIKSTSEDAALVVQKMMIEILS